MVYVEAWYKMFVKKEDEEKKKWGKDALKEVLRDAS
jgi:hypothetical protein